jgi:bifunctional oligoribonuclease and PAP phosphatase NrnA
LNSLSIEKAGKLLQDKDLPVCIITHMNPDGDAIGSSLGLYLWLCNAGFSQVEVIVPNPYPVFLQWMKGNERVINALYKPHKANRIINNANVIFCLDFNGLSRADKLGEYASGSKAARILIDHHPQPENEFDVVFSDTASSSTAELVYEFIHAMNGDRFMDRFVAECLYAGIVTDTGSFSYGCNGPRTFEITAGLIALGVDGAGIHQKIYSTYSANRLRLLGHCLSERLVVMEDHHTAYISLSKEDLKRFHYQVGDTEGVVNYAMSIENIHLAALFVENTDHVRISFRSAGKADVNVFARKFFNGGGHQNAAGGKCFDSLSETLLRFESLIKSGKADGL